MSLTQYKQKRTQAKTPEPFGGKAKSKGLVFVIQKHAASHLHYDFRLEMDGVLKSWAVPKGPSLNPSVKRLAMKVEDHPYDYRTFEGIIPQGQYGGGTVIVWDEGTYEPIEAVKGGKAAQEKHLLQQLKDGSLKFVLKGHKLKGEFALVKTKGMGDNAWLLIKHNDQHAANKDITLKDKSVVSEKTLEQVAKTSDNIYGQATQKTAAAKAPKKAAVKKAAKAVPAKKSPAVKKSELKSLLKGSTKRSFFTTVKPMLASLVDKAFDEKGWVYEVKWDGYR
ncbi:MAG TPA: DNA polymerase ligase N-terminal domain-containing protein, partial [Chitinophagaceae bacterium]|nr:DNA polymerase ligase N-terminal domain-containing protein [Chitinophagaceae bacterium]